MKPLGLVATLAVLPFLAMSPVVASNVTGNGDTTPGQIENALHSANRGMNRNDKRFKAMDQNKDGAVSAEEWETYHAKQAKKHFLKLDKNKDGKLTPNELTAKNGKDHDDGKKPHRDNDRRD